MFAYQEVPGIVCRRNQSEVRLGDATQTCGEEEPWQKVWQAFSQSHHAPLSVSSTPSCHSSILYCFYFYFFIRQYLTSDPVSPAAVLPHQLHQCDGAEHGVVRVPVAHDHRRHHRAARPPE